MSAVTHAISFTAGFIKQMVKDLITSSFNITAASGNLVMRIFNGIIGFFGSIVFGSFNLVKAFVEGVLNNLMLMVLVTAAFFMYTMYLQRQRELQNPSSAAAQGKIRGSTAAPRKTAMKQPPAQQYQPAATYTTAMPQQQAVPQPSVFGGAAQEAMRRVPVQAQQAQHGMGMQPMGASAVY